MRRRSVLALLAAGAAAGVVARQRLFGRGGERIDLYFEDGSIVSLEADSPEAEWLPPVARDLLSAVA